MVVRSLCKLLASKLKTSWYIDSDAREGDLIIFPEEHSDLMARKFNFQLYLNSHSDRKGLHYPFNADEFVKKLNDISQAYSNA